MTTIRCSSLPLFFSCAPALDGDLRISERNEAADLGSAAHEAIEAIAGGGEPDLDAIARRWSCNRDELGRLTWYAKKAWEVLAPSFPNPQTEVSVAVDLGDIKLTGHIDFMSISED